MNTQSDSSEIVVPETGMHWHRRESEKICHVRARVVDKTRGIGKRWRERMSSAPERARHQEGNSTHM